MARAIGDQQPLWESFLSDEVLHLPTELAMPQQLSPCARPGEELRPGAGQRRPGRSARPGVRRVQGRDGSAEAVHALSPLILLARSD